MFFIFNSHNKISQLGFWTIGALIWNQEDCFIAFLDTNSVRVDFIWRDSGANKLFMILIDQNRKKLLAVVPQQMMRLIYGGNLLGGVFSLNHFQIEPTYGEYPRYQEYSLLRDDLMIKISNNAMFNRLADAIISWFPVFPLVPSIKSLVEDRTERKMMIDIVGKIIRGKRKYSRYFGLLTLTSFTLYLQDESGSIIKMKLHITDRTRHQIVRTVYAIKRKYIIFVSRVKLVHLDSMNILISTKLSNVEFQPRMPEAFNIINMPRRIFNSV
ncbi:unnamed protein product [Lactuca saligna]|uniref:Uncharacterized protein n=1 Tax=Lactuca saligna TaxID=75948 RepID=A0AA35Z3W2_LACSI|nr:unnamed protein product [Lactuca saligna]